MYTGVTTFVLVGVIFLGRETWYHPQLPPTRSKPLELLGIEQLQSKRLRPSLIQAVSRAFKTVTKPAVLLLDLYYLVIIAWVVPISTVLLQPLTYFQQGIEDGSKGSFEDMEQNFNDHFGAGSSGSSFYSFSSGQQLGTWNAGLFLVVGFNFFFRCILSRPSVCLSLIFWRFSLSAPSY